MSVKKSKRVKVTKIPQRQKLLMLVFAVVVAAVGTYMALMSNAATPNGKLVYSVEGDGVYGINADGTGKTKLQKSFAIALSTPRHPSAQFVAYNQQRANNTWTVVTDLDSLKTYSFFKKLNCSAYHNLSINDVSFRPSVDTSIPRLVYVLRDEDCNNNRDYTDQIWATSADGSQRTMLAEVSTANIIDPVWSADTNKIYYRQCEREYDYSHCKLMLRTGGKTRSLAERVTGYSVSGDGKKLVYQENWQTVYVANSDGTSKKPILTTTAAGRITIDRNSASRLGKKILYSYATADDKTNSLRTVTTDGQVTIATISSSTEGLPYTHWAWSPNSDKIAYEYGRYEGEKTLKVINIDGTERHRIMTHPAGAQTTLDW